MQIDKQRILHLLITDPAAPQEQLERAQRNLPDHVDPEHHRDLLDELGVDPTHLLAKLDLPT